MATAPSGRFGSGSVQSPPKNPPVASAKEEPESVAARIALGIISITLLVPAFILMQSVVAAHELISPWLALGGKMGIELEIDGQSAIQMAIAALAYGMMVVTFVGAAITGVICAVTKRGRLALFAFVGIGLAVLVAIVVMFVPVIPGEYVALLLIPVIMCIVPLALVGALGYLIGR